MCKEAALIYVSTKLFRRNIFRASCKVMASWRFLRTMRQAFFFSAVEDRVFLAEYSAGH